VAADAVQRAPLVLKSRANSATSRRASTLGGSQDGSAHPLMRLMPVSPPSVEAADQALSAVDSRGGSAPSSAHQDSFQASLRMASAERDLPSVPPASGQASGQASWAGALQQASLLTLILASPTAALEKSLPEALQQPLAQALPPSSQTRISLQVLAQALPPSSQARISLQVLAQALPPSSQARMP